MMRFTEMAPYMIDNTIEDMLRDIKQLKADLWEEKLVAGNISGFARDPIETASDGYHFWDEVWADMHGPYLTRRLAVQALAKYVETL